MTSVKRPFGWINLAAIALLSSTPAWAGVGVDAAQLDPVALDSSIQCNRIFFQSSQHFKNTIFVMPRVIAGSGPGGSDRSFDISSGVDGNYILKVRLYFPNNEETVPAFTGASSVSRDFNSCDLDEVKHSLNKNLEDAQKIKTIAPIPLTSIEAKIPGIKDVGRIGISDGNTDEADILDYNGKSLTAIFKITAQERDLFQSQIVAGDGLVASVRFRFQARHRDGSVTAMVDVNGLQAAFAAAVAGKVYITKAELAIKLKAVIDKRNISITSEAGSDSFEKIQNNIIDKVLKEISLAADAGTPAPDAKVDDAGQGQVTVKAALDAIATKLSREISFSQMAMPETATAQSEVRLRATSIDDPNIFQIKIQSRYRDPSTNFELNAGKTISISPAYWFLDHIDYDSLKLETYLTKSKIDDLELAQSGNFPDLNNSAMVIKNREANGKYFAVGYYYNFSSIIPATMPYNPFFRNAPYFWVRTRRYPSHTHGPANRFSPDLATFQSIRVALSFAKLGDRNLFPFANLLQTNPYWTAQYDQASGRMMITALQDLGTIQFRELTGFTGKEEYKTAPVNWDTVVEMQDRPLDVIKVTKSIVVKDHHDEEAITLQKNAIFNVTRPQVMPASGPIPGATSDAQIKSSTTPSQ